MFSPKYKIYLNGKYFDSIYTVDYYNDKKVFFETGAKQFFVLFQLFSIRKFEIKIEETEKNTDIVLNNELQFKEWGSFNYPMYLNYLENYN